MKEFCTLIYILATTTTPSVFNSIVCNFWLHTEFLSPETGGEKKGKQIYTHTYTHTKQTKLWYTYTYTHTKQTKLWYNNSF